MRVKGTSKTAERLATKLDGWQPGLAVVLFAFASAVLSFSRPVPPREVPEPVVSLHEVVALRSEEARRAEAARSSLGSSSRALGAAVREFGQAEVSGDGRALAEARGVLASRLAAVPPEERPQLLLLRAFQTEAFTQALRAWQIDGEVSRDFRELGGSLVEAFRGAGWCVERDGRRHVLLDDDELGVAFRKRWNALLGLDGPAIRASLAEERLLFAFAVRHPRVDAALRVPGAHAPVASAQSLLRRIDQHAKLDPEYPEAFARGVVFYAAGQYARSAMAFDAHLKKRPDGPLAARARNHALAALAAEIGEDPSPSWFSF